MATTVRPNTIDRTLTKAVVGAHNAVDKAASAAAPAANWLSEQGESLNATGEKYVADVRSYVSTNPLKSVAIVLAAGLVLGRLLR